MTIPFYTDLSEFSTPPNFKGVWDFRKAYSVGSIVDYNGKLYVAQSLVNHSGDTLTLLNHDDFHREDTLDGWGTSAEGITWITDYEQDGPGSLKIFNNEGVSSSSGSFVENVTSYPIPELATKNIEVLWKFYVPDSNQLNLFLYFLTAEGENYPSVDFRLVYNLSFSELFMEINTGRNVGDANESYSLVAPLNLPLDLNTDYFVRLRHYTNFYGSKLWKVSEQEPIDWDVVLLTKTDLTLSTDLVFDTWPFNDEGGSVHVKDVKVYGLPDVSPDHMPDEWSLIG